MKRTKKVKCIKTCKMTSQVGGEVIHSLFIQHQLLFNLLKGLKGNNELISDRLNQLVIYNWKVLLKPINWRGMERGLKRWEVFKCGRSRCFIWMCLFLFEAWKWTEYQQQRSKSDEIWISIFIIMLRVIMIILRRRVIAISLSWSKWAIWCFQIDLLFVPCRVVERLLTIFPLIWCMIITFNDLL